MHPAARDVVPLSGEQHAVPEVGHLRAAGEYREASAAFAAGTPDGLARWFAHCARAWQTGAREGAGIAEAAAS